MKRLRSLCMFIICLLVVAVSGPALAGKATVFSGRVERETVTTSLPGDERGDCGKTSCASVFGCAAPCIAGASLLVASAAEVPPFTPEHHAWPFDPASLLGERPPPEPLPPKV